DVGAESALRANGEAIEWDISHRLVDATLELIDRFELRHFRADQAEHHHLVLRHEAQRREAAGAGAVVLEEDALVRQLVEQALGDRVVAAFAVPHAALVAAAKMDAESD